mgnify:FL=1
MAKANEIQSIRDYGRRKKRIRRRNILIISILLFALLASVVVYIINLINKSYQNYEVVNNVKNTSEKAVGYLKYGSSVIKYTKNGAVAIRGNGNVLWNVSYEMSDPIADVCNEYVVIADRGKNSIYIMNKNGAVGNFTTLNKIIKVKIAKQGVVAALMEDEDKNIIKLYSLDDTIITDSVEDNVIVEKISNIRNEGYPMDIALSEDGKKLLVSFLSISEGELLSTIGFYNFGDVGKSYINSFVGGYEFKNIVIPKVEFLDNDTAAVFKEDGFLLYSIPELPELIYDISVEKEIKKILYNNRNLGYVLSGDGTNDQLKIYDFKGNLILDEQISSQYNKIRLFGDEIIMYNNLNCLIQKINGKEKFRHAFDTNVEEIIPINNLDRYFIINESEVLDIMLKE